MTIIKDALDSINDQISRSTFGRVFRLDGSGHDKERKGSCFLTEIRAGMTTFFTMAYIIAVNSSILAESGATCVCFPTHDDMFCDRNVEYNSCLIGLFYQYEIIKWVKTDKVQDVKRDFITATAAVAGIGSFAFGFLTNLPIALAPGMGLNAYFTYQVVGYHGSGNVSYRLALTAVFVEGFIFMALSLLGLRQWLVKIIPSSIKVASGVGIGLFLTEIGMSYSGIGLITGSRVTPTDLAGCLPEYIDADGTCGGHKMTSPTLWIGITCGGFLTAFLMSYKIKSAMIIGIVIVSVISWPRDTSFTYFPRTPEGDILFDFFKQIIAFHPIKHTLGVLDWNVSVVGGHFALALFTFLYVDIIDATATLYSMARFSGVVDNVSGDFPRSTLAYCTDAMTITVGSLFGCSPVTAFIESGAGIILGGRTGLTAMTTGVCFLVSIFLAPIFASIPPWATGCTLILVGCMMMIQITEVNWAYIGDALPAFITIVAMPFTYSVAYGLIAGLLCYTVLNGMIYMVKKLTGGRIEPSNIDDSECWVSKAGANPPWFIRAMCKKIWGPSKLDDDMQSLSAVTEASDKELVDGVHLRR
ncbi:putative xanthine/uracil permease [Golovinomyces cichoracearum]|uniref:Putative xanthine/uracil permease n=1 Tax=Golovinomyces cichoracearum TaxID=62708 RepID=A0A420HDM7_9PEZI|nr:putative xanthine/uracil permease [Golovinomyces cichoracearum]